VVLQPVLGHGFPDLFPLTYSLFLLLSFSQLPFSVITCFSFLEASVGVLKPLIIYEVKSASHPTHGLEDQGFSFYPASHSKPGLHVQPIE